MKKKNIQTIKARHVVIISIVLSFFLLILLSWFFSFRHRVYPGVYFNETSLSGKTFPEVRSFFLEKITEMESRGVKFKDEDGKEVTKKKFESLDSGPNYSFISFFLDESSLSAFDSSKNSNFFLFLGHFFKNKNSKKIKVKIEIEKNGLDYFLEESFSDLIIKPENAYFSTKKDALTKEDVLIVNQEKIGKKIDKDRALIELKKVLEELKDSEIIIKTVSDYPQFNKSDLESFKFEAEKIIKTGKEIELFYIDKENKERVWKIKPEDLVYWLEIEKNFFPNKVILKEESISAYLDKYLSERINQDIVLPKLEVIDGKVNDWEIGKDGRVLNLEKSSKKIKEAFKENEPKVYLEIDELKVDSFVSENDFKIKEVIGTGQSNFQGSSANRIHNIKVGAKTLHGLLIKPGEEFSLIKALGKIDGDNGYKTELVIKGNKTVPEYGGGLCQVGTSLFRTVVRSGLPVTMRRNHSYRVSYYEPAGTDATIYNPWPDFRFINDTGNYILIQSRIEKNELFFDLWGTNDGRKIEITEPVIYNIVKPPETKYIETEDLAPGEIKCTEKSHNGASAYFDYKVTYPEGATTTPVVQTRFSSYYVPWQAVCLIGKDKKELEVEKKEPSEIESSNQVE